MNKLGIIDIGSNSFRLVLVNITDFGSYEIIDEVKETVRLGENMEYSQTISSAKIDKAILTLKLFKNLCDAMKVTVIIAVGTEAVRKAINKEYFVNLVFEETGINIRILSGEEEAYYDYLGVINSIDVKNCLIMDVGGCSTELIHVSKRRFHKKISIPYGAINLTDKFNLQKSINDFQRTNLENFLNQIFDNIPWLKENNFKKLIGIGGSMRNLSSIHRHHTNYPLDISHNYKMKKADIQNIYTALINIDYEDRKSIKGLSKERTDIFTASAAEIATLINYCEIEEVIVSGKGLREGIIYEYLLNGCCPIEDILDYSLNTKINNLNINKQHAYNVYNICLKLSENLFSEEKFNNSDKKIIKTLSLLHEHSINSFDMILNSNLDGLTHRELLISAYASMPSLGKPIPKFDKLLKSDDLILIKKLRLILNVAELIEKNNLKCKIDDNNLVLKQNSSKQIKNEINELYILTKNFKELYNKDLIII